MIASDKDERALGKYFNHKAILDSASAIKLSKDIIHSLLSKGYLTAAIDSITFSEKEIIIYPWIGNQYQWAKLATGNLDDRSLSQAGFRKKHFENKLFSYPEISSIFDKILKSAESHGYPFASIRLDSIAIDQNRITAQINFLEGPYITFDSLRVHGNSKIKKRFLENYLKIVQGQPYDEKSIKEINSKIKRLPYLKLSEAPQVTFQNSEGTVHLFVEDKKVNQVDGIIGFFPNAGNDNKLLLTGQFNLLLQNIFGSGKALHLEWQKIKPLSQLLDISYFHPNLLSSPINVGGSFYLLKEDTTFLNRDAGINFSVNKGLYSDVRLYTKIRTANLLYAAQYKNNTHLPDYADFVLQTYGAGYQWSDLDDIFFPTKGLHLDLDGSVGNKKIIKNGSLPSELYEGVQERSLQLSMSVEVSKYIPVKKRAVILGRLRGGIIHNDQLFLNDLFRIGGLNSLRGFNENFFFASQFATATCEVRMMLDQQSFFLLFADQGLLKFNLANNKYYDRPTGIGLGFNIALEGGIFNFIYALGGSNAQLMNFQGSKIHFGYISRF
ncbi:MAG: BamA/TamA family outer membrane protein [Bacteroidota bacterium]|nr:BamA/TamA family outer membrane protein [Bacteroidota bacterium]